MREGHVGVVSAWVKACGHGVSQQERHVDVSRTM